MSSHDSNWPRLNFPFIPTSQNDHVTSNTQRNSGAAIDATIESKTQDDQLPDDVQNPNSNELPLQKEELQYRAMQEAPESSFGDPVALIPADHIATPEEQRLEVERRERQAAQLQMNEEQLEHENARTNLKQMYRLVLFGFAAALLFSVILVASLCATGHCKRSVEQSQRFTSSPSFRPTLSPTAMTRREMIMGYIYSVSLLETPFREQTPEYLALQWLIDDDPRMVDGDFTQQLLNRYVLALLWFASSSPWTNDAARSQWLSIESECNWYQVQCSEGQVSEIDLTDVGLSGQIQTDMALLSRLQFLSLGGNALSGQIPDIFPFWPDLLLLSVSGNQLRGWIPTSLGTLRSLRVLSMFDNLLSGPIPSSLGDLSNLSLLGLVFNRITGPIPTSIGNLASLETFAVSLNSLTGTIPTSMGSMLGLQELVLNDNNLTGSIPTEFGRLTELTDLSVQTNRLNGTIPHSLFGLTRLTRINLGGNNISGSIPSALGLLRNLTFLALGSNMFSGKILEWVVVIPKRETGRTPHHVFFTNIACSAKYSIGTVLPLRPS